MIACWHYIDVPDTIWKIPKLEDVWGINVKTADHLRRLGINNMYDLAHSDPAILKKEFGVIGDQLFAMSWGVDRSIIKQKYRPKSKSYGNSQILSRDYEDQRVTDFFAHYQDRGMKKWAGFFLSDHTAMINKETRQKSVPDRAEIVGFVQGYAEDKVVIGEHVIALDDLRRVLLLSD